MLLLDHPHICTLYEYFVEDDSAAVSLDSFCKPGDAANSESDCTDPEDVVVYLILELLEGPDLFDYMLQVFRRKDGNGRFQEEDAALVLRYMLKSVLGCHSANIVHRDIKPENFMFQRKPHADAD